MPTVRHLKLTPGAVTPVPLPGPFDEIEVISKDGAAEVYFRVDGQDPVINGDDCECLPAVIGGQTITTYADATLETSVVKLLSTGAPRVMVRAW